MKVGASHTPSLTSLPLTSHRRRSVGEEGLLQAAALAPVVETGESENVRGLVSDSIAIVQAFAELRYGAVVHTRENSVKYGPRCQYSRGPRLPEKRPKWYTAAGFFAHATRDCTYVSRN